MKLLDEIKQQANKFLPKAKPYGVEDDYTSRWDSLLKQQNFQDTSNATRSALQSFGDLTHLVPQAVRAPQFTSPQQIFNKTGEGLNTVIKPNFDAAVKVFDKGYKRVGDWLNPADSMNEFTTLSENARKQGIYGIMPGQTMDEKKEFEAKLDAFKPLNIPVGSVLKFFNSESDEVTQAREKLMRGETLTKREKNLLEQQQLDFVMGMTGGGLSSVGESGLNAAKTGTANTFERLSPSVVEDAEGIAKKFPAQAQDKLKYLVRGVDDLVKGQGMTLKDAERVRFPEYKQLMSGGGSPTAAEDFIQSLEPLTPSQKVNVLDYFRTPEHVLEKIGLKQQAQFLRTQYEGYLTELPQQIKKITGWSQRVAPESNERIFRYLDGDKVLLEPEELQVAGEIKEYLGKWADRLKLPKEKRISNYITHIFSDSEKEFDPDFAKLIRNKVAGSVYNPFFETRKGADNYIRDTWQALDAYTKRAVRKANLDPALEQLKNASENLETSQYNYVKSYIDRVNMRPTDLDNLVDNFIKSTPVGYKYGNRPTTVLTGRARQMVSRGLLGLNVGSALRNLTQGVNTYAELGEKYTLIGYSKVAQNMGRIAAGAPTELDEVGVLGQDLIQDRTLSATKQFWQKVDPLLYSLFDRAEQINRGAAYWGAKSKFLDAGMDEAEAIANAKALVRTTQFNFGSIDTPLVLSSDLAKTFFQFGSYSLKQAEFLANMMKSKDVAGLVRYIGASLLIAGTVGKAWGMEPTDMIPTFRFGVPPTLQLPYGVGQAALVDTDKYGNKLSAQDRILNKNVVQGGLSYIPASKQASKTLEGFQAIQNGGVFTKDNNLKYPVEPGLQPLLFGSNVTEGAKNYYNDGSPLGKNQTRTYDALVKSGMNPQQAVSVVKASAKTEEPEERQGIMNKLVGIWNGLFSSKAEENIPEPTDPLLKAWKAEKDDDQKTTDIKDIFALGLSRQETEKALKAKGISYEEATTKIAKSLGVENGVRGSYIKTILAETSGNDFISTVWYLAEQEILTQSVLSKWVDDGEITEDQERQFKAVINATKGKAPAKGKNLYKVSIPEFRWKSFPGGSVSVPRPPKVNLQGTRFVAPKITPPRLKQRLFTPGEI